MEVILASGNAGKLKEFEAAFADLGIRLIPQPATAEYEVEESGTTFVENAIIKARHASQLSGLPALADDSGLIVPALNGEPGVYSARYAGPQANSTDNLNRLLDELQGQPDRSAHFFCCLVFMRHHQDPDPLVARGSWHGSITLTPAGTGGFGYDPVFQVSPDGCTAAELSAVEKQAISHRGQAIRAMHPMLADLFK